MRSAEVLAQQAREKAGDERRAAIGQLKLLAMDSLSRDEAVQALVNLWRGRLATPADVAPFAPTVLKMWHRVSEQVKPFQQETVKVEWMMDEDYGAVSSEAEALLALLGYFPGDEIGRSLRDALSQLTDPDLKMFAILSLLRRHDAVPPEEIETVAASHLVRIYFWEHLQELGMEALMSAEWASPEALAASELSRWLSHPNELGVPPEEIELVDIFAVPTDESETETEEVYLFRFREYPKPWEPGEGWMAGIAGPYRDGRVKSPWSSFRRWDSMSPQDHVVMLYYRGSGNCPRGEE